MVVVLEIGVLSTIYTLSADSHEASCNEPSLHAFSLRIDLAVCRFYVVLEVPSTSEKINMSAAFHGQNHTMMVNYTSKAESFCACI